jgi:hypothetical protein
MLLARRTGELPELLMGVALLGLGPFGSGLRMAAPALEAELPVLAASLRGAGALGILIGAGAHYFFVVQVFRPRSRPAWGLALLASALLAASYVGDILARGLVNTPAPGAWYWLGMGLRMFALAWSCAEALACWRRLRRRLRIGLADPVVVHRFLLWSLGAGVPFAGLSFVTLRRLLLDTCPSHDPLLAVVLVSAGVLATAFMWLGFRPPAFYRRWIAGRGGAGTVPSPPSRA